MGRSRRRQRKKEEAPATDAHDAEASWLQVGAGLLGRVTSAFAPNVARRQTDIMEKSGAVSISAADLRARVDDLADRLVSGLERTADRIGQETGDPSVRRRALAFKADVIPAVYTAAYRADPLVAAMDTWALTFQIKEYVETGRGRDAFGAQQPLAKAQVRDLVADADASVRSMATSQKRFDTARTKMGSWVTSHPIEYAFSSRSSVGPLLTQWRSEDRGAFVAVGEMTDTVQTLSERLNIYAAQMPRQVRWQAELLVADLADQHDVPVLLGAAGQAVREVVATERRAVLEDVNNQRQQTLDYVTAERRAVLEEVNGQRQQTLDYLTAERRAVLENVNGQRQQTLDYLTAERRAVLEEVNGQRQQTLDYLTAERRAVLENVNGQRQQTLDFLTVERRAVLEDVNSQRQQTLDYLTGERRAAVEALRQERIEALTAVEALQGRVVDSAVARLRSLVDYTLWRLAVLLAILTLSATTLGVLVYRLTAGRPG